MGFVKKEKYGTRAPRLRKAGKGEDDGQVFIYFVELKASVSDITFKQHKSPRHQLILCQMRSRI